MIYVIVFVVLKAVMDSISHHDSFKKLGCHKFFWRETAEGPKRTFLQKYFPMFYDMWHLSTTLQVLMVAWLASGTIVGTLLLYTIGNIVFIAVYEGLR
jgi:hypothetical protein